MMEKHMNEYDVVNQTHLEINFQMSNPAQCWFKDCTKPVLPGFNRCQVHKHRSPCSVPNCLNQVYARYLCVRHGGKKICAFKNCTIYARGGGFCGKHGGTVNKRFCLVEGCKKQAHANQKCVRHGGGRFCKADDCTFHSRAGGFCLKHRTTSSSEPAQTESNEVLDKAILECIINDEGDNEMLAQAAPDPDIDPLDMSIVESLLDKM
ncbi:hypothetical protein THRCLA_05245 [Thraustotheca clavata]|uniref:Uncharacterized protein n=1 Tax=Thraustotheca clavata TaxID=74557 RepID=A0A1V9ZWN7_9STRA|nr:hypothetical protein THRCLA_05245 [Thraustotheca clavata]